MFSLLLTCLTMITQVLPDDTVRTGLRVTCARGTQQPRPAAEDSVWAAVLAGLGARTEQPVLLVSDSTEAPSRFGPGDTSGLKAFDSLVAELEPTIVADFLARNAEPVRVNAAVLKAVGVRRPVHVLSRVERAEAPVDPGTGLYRFERFPGAEVLVSLSRVGFSRDSRQALVHLEFSCGPRCGNTQLVLLTREADGKWRESGTGAGITY